MNQATSNNRLSETFCDPSADVDFESSDGVIFKIHSKHLPSTSFGFSTEEGASVVNSQPAKLSESATILELLFQFVEPPAESRHHQHPSLVDLDYDLFFALAEAAEKYVVFACMSMCATRMRFDTAMMMTHALDILNHSFKHGYNDLVLQSITRTLQDCDFELVANKLTTPGLLVQWLKYYEKWRQVAVFGDVTLQTATATYQCPKLYAKWNAYIRQCARRPNQAGTLVHTYTDVPRQIISLPCVMMNCPCNTLENIATMLINKTRAVPPFDSLQ